MQIVSEQHVPFGTEAWTGSAGGCWRGTQAAGMETQHTDGQRRVRYIVFVIGAL